MNTLARVLESRSGPLFAVVVTGVLLATAVTTTRVADQPVWRTVLDWTLVLAVCAAVPLRTRYPVAAATFSLVTTNVFYVISSIDGPLIILPMAQMAYAAALGHLVAGLVLGASAVVITGLGTIGNEDFTGVTLLMLSGWVLAMLALGLAVHSRSEQLRVAEERAAEQAVLRATQERLRIARELHDVIGHNIALISVQAGTALHRFDKDAERAREALTIIRDAGRETMREVRGALGVLRQVDEEPLTGPAGRLDRVGDLLRTAESAGIATELRVEGEPGPLPSGTDLAAFRIVQESITNVVRHAGATRLRVTLDYGADALTVEVGDDGAGGGAGVEDGGGLTGMRERARALGGELSAGPGADGWTVRARLPLREDG